MIVCKTRYDVELKQHQGSSQRFADFTKVCDFIAENRDYCTGNIIVTRFKIDKHFNCETRRFDEEVLDSRVTHLVITD